MRGRAYDLARQAVDRGSVVSESLNRFLKIEPQNHTSLAQSPNTTVTATQATQGWGFRVRR